MSERLAAYAREHRLGLALLVAVTVVIPLGLTLARDDGYESRVALYKDGPAGGDQTREELRRYIQSLVPVASVARGTAINVRYPLDQDTVVENTRFEFRSDAGIDLIATSGTPERAAGMAQLEASLVENLSIRRSGTAGGRYPEIPRLVTRLGDRSTSAAERRRLQARLEVILAELDASAPRLEVRGVVITEPVTGGLDELADSLPGDFSPNPGPFAAALAGLVLGLGLFTALALAGPLRDAASRPER